MLLFSYATQDIDPRRRTQTSSQGVEPGHEPRHRTKKREKTWHHPPQYLKMKNFSEAERSCEAAFLSRGPFWHLFTPGIDTPLIFSEIADYKYLMNLQAKCYYQHPSVKLISFANMGNHVHQIQSGHRDEVLLCFESIRKGLLRYFASQGKAHLLDSFAPCLKEIVDLKQLRNNIVYVHRNGYVADPRHTPFSYPWSTGRYYFNDFPILQRFSDLNYREAREVFCSRHPDLPADYLMIEGYVAPTSYCDVLLGMSLFRDAHQYYSLLGRNVEAYAELAHDFGDGVFLTDNELYTYAQKLSREVYSAHAVGDLNKSQVIELARKLHNECHAGNGQLRRILSLPQAEVDSLFPLSAKRR